MNACSLGPIPFHIVVLSSFQNAKHSADGRRTRFTLAMTSLRRRWAYHATKIIRKVSAMLVLGTDLLIYFRIFDHFPGAI